MRKLQLKTMLLMLLMAVGGLSPAWAADKTVVKYSFDDAMSPSLTAGSRVSFDYGKTSVITSTTFLNAYNNTNGDPGSSTVSLGSTDLSGETWTLSFEWAACGGCNSKADHTTLKAGTTNLFDLTGNSNWNTTVTITYDGSDGTKTLPVPGCDKGKRFTAAVGDQLNTTAYWHHIVVTGSASGVKMTITNSSTGTAVVENVVLSETNVNPTSLIIEPCCGGAIGIDELSLTYFVEGEVIQTPVANYTAVNGIERTITATCDTEGATLYYSTDGENWTEGASVTVSASGNVYFKAVKGNSESDVLTFAAVAGEAITLNAPTIVRSDNTTVTISADQTNLLLSPTATIKYTYGNEAGEFTGSKTLTVAADATITAYAEATGYTTSATSERAVALFPEYVNSGLNIPTKTSGTSSFALSTETITVSGREYAALLLDDVQWGTNVYLQKLTITDPIVWGIRNGDWYINTTNSQWILIRNLKANDIVVVDVTSPAADMVNATYSEKLSFGTKHAYIVNADGDVELDLRKINAKEMNYFYGVYSYSPMSDEEVAAIKALQDAKTALATAIAEAKAIETEGKEGVEALQTAIATAEAALAAEDATTESLTAAAEALAAAITAYRAANTLASGKYYFKNMASGKFWGAGNDWGTQASLLDHPEYVTLAKLEDGKYTMESQVTNGGTAYYFNGNYMDNGSPVSLTIVKDGGVFTVADGDNYFGYDGSTTVLGKNLAADSENAKWQIYSEAEMLATLNDATIDEPVDATFLILDQGFGRNNRNETKVADNNWTGVWTMTAANQNLSGGNNVNNNAESYHSTFTLTQTINGAPKGVYALTAQGFYRQDGSDNDNLPYFYIKGLAEENITFPFKEGSENSMSDASVSFTAGKYKTDAIFAQVGDDGVLEVGAKNPTNTELWCIFDNFELKYYGDLALDEVKNAALIKQVAELRATVTTLLEGDYNDGVKAVLNSALEATENVTPTIDALTAAIATLNEAVSRTEAYDIAKPKLTNMKAVVDATNVYTADAYETYYGQWLTKFNDGTLTKAEAAALQDPSVVTGWHAAVTVDNFLLSAWDTNADFVDPAPYYINTWSNEGETDGSDFKVPFFEYWTSAAKLDAKTLTATITGLEAGNYKATAWVRVSSASAPTGINMQVCDGKTVDVTNGTQIGETTRYMRQVSAFGIVGDDGVLTIKFNVLDETNVTWLSFKNVKFEKITLDFDALNDAIADARTLNSSVTNGVKALSDLIAEGEALLESAESQNEIDACVEALNEAITAASSIIPARKNLAGVAKKAAALKSYLSTDITEEVTAASEYAVNAEATAAEATTKANALNAYFSEWETIELTNADFDDPEGWNGELIAPGTNEKPYVHAVKGWTQNFKFSSTASQGIAAEYGSPAQNGTNGVAAPAADMFGNSDGGALHLSSGWNDQARYYQTVELPVGKYVFYYEGYNANNTNNSLNSNYFGVGGLTAGDINGTNNTFIYSDEKNFAYNEWKAVAFDFTIVKNVENANVNVGVIGGTAGSANTPKMWFDNVTIFKIDGAATESDYADLNTAISAAEAEAEGKVLGFDKDEYAPYVNAAVMEALIAAKAIDQEAVNLKSDVQAATAALNEATWTANEDDVDAIFNGNMAIANGNNPKGWTRSNNAWGQQITGLGEATSNGTAWYYNTDGAWVYGNDGSYTMPLKGNTVYKLSFKYCSQENNTNNWFKASIVNAGGESIFETTYPKATEKNWVSVEKIFSLPADGNYVLHLYNSGNTYLSDVSLVKAEAESITINETETYAVSNTTDRYGNVTFNRTLVEGWNGLVLPFDMTVENVATTFNASNASKVKNFTGITYDEAKGVTLNFANFAAETVIPAGTPFLVKTNAAGTSYTINGVLLPATGLQNITWTADGNDNIQYTMKGTHAASTDLTNVSFALIQGNKFYYHDGTAGKESKAQAFRAYFENESTEPAAARVSFDFGEDETTGITDLAQPKTAADGTYYDLQGRKVENFKQKGIYILNGRKVVK